MAGQQPTNGVTPGRDVFRRPLRYGDPTAETTSSVVPPPWKPGHPYWELLPLAGLSLFLSLTHLGVVESADVDGGGLVRMRVQLLNVTMWMCQLKNVRGFG